MVGWLVGRMSEVFGSIDNAHGASASCGPWTRLDHLMMIFASPSTTLGIISSASNWKLYKNNEKNKKEEAEAEIVNGGGRERERGAAHRTT